MAEQDKKEQSQVKQGAVTPRRLRVEGFRGAFLDARFNDEGISEEPVSRETEEALRSNFPGARLEPVASADKAEGENKEKR